MKDFMHMSEPIRRAYEIAKKAHAGQVDKAGKDYIYHPMTVASNVGDDETAIIVACCTTRWKTRMSPSTTWPRILTIRYWTP